MNQADDKNRVRRTWRDYTIHEIPIRWRSEEEVYQHKLPFPNLRAFFDSTTSIYKRKIENNLLESPITFVLYFEKRLNSIQTIHLFPTAEQTAIIGFGDVVDSCLLVFCNNQALKPKYMFTIGSGIRTEDPTKEVTFFCDAQDVDEYLCRQFRIFNDGNHIQLVEIYGERKAPDPDKEHEEAAKRKAQRRIDEERVRQFYEKTL